MSATSRPLAAVTLSDGQTLRCEVLGRTRGEDGRWWYTLRTVLPGDVAVEFRAPYPTVQPLPGQPYNTLDGQQAAPDQTWRVTSVWRPAGQLVTVHGDGCWLDLAGARKVTAGQAAELVREGAERCDVCEPSVVHVSDAVRSRPENE